MALIPHLDHHAVATFLPRVPLLTYCIPCNPYRIVAPAHVCRKHLNMRMAIGGQTFENMEKPKIYGRKKSDITVHGALYERSYQ